MLQQRWSDSFAVLSALARNPAVPKVTRARLLVMAGDIDLYYTKDRDAADRAMKEAATLAPADDRVLGGQADFCLDGGDIDGAALLYTRAIAAAPRDSGGYTGMGDCAERRNDLTGAEEWYRKAIAASPGDATGYDKLLKLYGRPELFSARRADFERLIEPMAAVVADGLCQMHIDLGAIYLNNHELDAALKAFEHAIQIDPTNLESYLSAAEVHEERKDLGSATQRYRQAIEIARQILQAEKADTVARTALERIAEAYYTKHGDIAAALTIYDDLLARLGEPYRGSYHNLRGNASFYVGQYASSRDDYAAAIAAARDNPVFHRNLAGALRELRNYPDAAVELRRAFELDKDQKTFDRERARLFNLEGIALFEAERYHDAIDRYGSAMKLTPEDDVLYWNLASAWARIKTPGTIMPSLEHAVTAITRAHELKPTDQYRLELERLQQTWAFGRLYGDQALARSLEINPIAVEIAADLVPFFEGTGANALTDDVTNQLLAMRQRVQQALGVRLPGVRFRGSGPEVPKGSYLILIRDVPVVLGNVDSSLRFFAGPSEALTKLGVTANEGQLPVNHQHGFWVDSKDWPAVERAGLELWSAVEYIIRHLQGVIEANLVDLLLPDDVMALADRAVPDAAKELAQSPDKLMALVMVARALLAERVSIAPFAEIQALFGELYADQPNLQTIVETIRNVPAVRSLLPGTDTSLPMAVLGPHFEREIAGAISATGSHTVLAMLPERCQETLAAIRNTLTDHPSGAVVVTDATLRPFVRLLVELEFPTCPVLARRELPPNRELQNADRIELDAAPDATSTSAPGAARSTPRKTAGVWNAPASPATTEIAVFVNPAFPTGVSGADETPLPQMLQLGLDAIFSDLGLILPEVRLDVDASLGANQFRFRLNGSDGPALTGLATDEFLVNESVERLKLLNMNGEPTTNPLNGTAATRMRETNTKPEECRKAGLATFGPGGVLVLHLTGALKKRASEFQTVACTEYALGQLRPMFPHLIRAALTRFSAAQIAAVLGKLLDEQISIRDLPAILMCMASITGTIDVDSSRLIVFVPPGEALCVSAAGSALQDLGAGDYADCVRASLKRYISHRYTRGSNSMVVYLLDQVLEQRLEHAESLTTAERSELLSKVNSQVGALGRDASNPVVLTTTSVRRTVRNLLSPDFPFIDVLAYQELSADVNIQPLGRISLS